MSEHKYLWIMNIRIFFWWYIYIYIHIYMNICIHCSLFIHNYIHARLHPVVFQRGSARPYLWRRSIGGGFPLEEGRTPQTRGEGWGLPNPLRFHLSLSIVRNWRILKVPTCRFSDNQGDSSRPRHFMGFSDNSRSNLVGYVMLPLMAMLHNLALLEIYRYAASMCQFCQPPKCGWSFGKQDLCSVPFGISFDT